VRTPFTELVGVAHPIVGFNRSPAVVAAVTNAGGLGVLAASAFTAPELDAQLTWIEEQVGGKPYGVDLLVPETSWRTCCAGTGSRRRRRRRATVPRL
jgi:NAD(P)H-dependent flavin oxidoreductase YrpB (nitropropane dioxygenase family)